MEDKLLKLLKSSGLKPTDLLCYVEGGEENGGKDFQITSKDFLRFARQDFNERTERGFINSLTNSKRAIDCQVDFVLETFGINLKHRHLEEYVRMFDFDESDIAFKLKIIFALNLAPYLIIAKTRTLRNKLEHLYQMPKESEVREALDIADLFIRSVEGKINMVKNIFLITDDKNLKEENSWRIFKHLHFTYNKENKDFIISLKENDFAKEHLEEITINSSDKEYYALLSVMLSNEDELSIEDSVKKLLSLIGHPVPMEKVKVELLT